MRERSFNLVERLGASDRSTPRAEAAAVRAAIQSVLDNVDVRALGGILYVPRSDTTRGRPGAWFVDVTTDLVLPPNLELRLAPGAALVPISLSSTGSGALDVLGPLSAPIGPIFATSASATRWRPELASTPYAVRPVRLTGRALERVHPEWWGAGTGDADLDGPALAAAVRAAYVDRWLGSRWLPPLVVELSQRYELAETLVVSGASGTRGVRPGTLTLRGLPGAADDPHLVCAAGRAFSGRALVAVRDAIVSLDAVSLDATMAADACVQIETTLVGAPLDGSGHRLYQCVLRGATGALLRLDVTDEGKGDGAAQGPALTVEGGVFEPKRSPVTWQTPVAARLVAPSATTVAFRSVAFSGEARAMIHASSCMVSVTHCAFRNDDVPVRRHDDPSLLDTLHASGPEGGVDILLDAAHLNDLAASVSAMHCQSSSLQFLVARGVAPGRGGRDSTIVGLHHDSHTLGVSQFRSGGTLFKSIEPLPIKSGGLGPKDPNNERLPRLPLHAPLPLPVPVVEFPFTSRSSTTIVPAILWDGEAQGGSAFTLCACRFDRTGAATSSAPAVVTRRTTQPVRDLGAARGNPRATFPVFQVAQRVAPEEVLITVPT